LLPLLQYEKEFGVPRKPWTIILLFLIYLLSPFFIVFFNAWMNMVPLIGPGGILRRLRAADWLVLSLYFVNAAAIFTVRKPGWWIFLGSSAVLIGYNLYGYLQNPMQPFPALLLYNALLFGGAALLFRREIIAPYFNPRLRWWESEPRYQLDFYGILSVPAGGSSADGAAAVRAAVRDISESGCFLSTSIDLPRAADLPLEIRLRNIRLHVKARAVRRAERPFPGWGMKFTELREAERHGLKAVLDSLRELSGISEVSDERRSCSRLTLSQWVYWDDIGGRKSGMITNVSVSGCCLEHEVGCLAGTGEYLLHFSDFDEQLLLPASKVWQRMDGTGTHTGVHFHLETREMKKRLQRFVCYCKRAGSRERNEDKKLDEALVRASLAMTPFARLYGKRYKNGDEGRLS
jgi:hypothetical protein